MQTVNQEQMHNDDDIDFRLIIEKLIKHKKIFLAVTLIAIISTAFYALSLKPEYQASISYLPPSQTDITAINAPIKLLKSLIRPEATTLKLIEKTDVYSDFEQNLDSVAIRRKAFDQMFQVNESQSKDNLQLSRDQQFLSFNREIEGIRPKKKNTSPARRLTLSISGSTPGISSVVEKISREAIDSTKQELFSQVNNAINSEINLLKNTYNSDLKTLDLKIKNIGFEKENRIKIAIENEKKTKREEAEREAKTKREEAEREAKTKVNNIEILEKEIAILKKNAKLKREDKIKVLTEAAVIAESMGIEMPNSETPYSDSQPEYLRGLKSLNAEILILKKRTSDDSFIPELRELQNKLELLKSTKNRLHIPTPTPTLNVDLQNQDTREDDSKISVQIEETMLTLKQEELKLKQQKQQILELIQKLPPVLTLNGEKNQKAWFKFYQIDPDVIKVAKIDQPAASLLQPFKPSRPVILLLGLITGVFLGTLAVLLFDFWKTFSPQK